MRTKHHFLSDNLTIFGSEGDLGGGGTLTRVGLPVSAGLIEDGPSFRQGAKEIIFTACHSGKLKLPSTNPDVISTSLKSFLTNRIH